MIKYKIFFFYVSIHQTLLFLCLCTHRVGNREKRDGGKNKLNLLSKKKRWKIPFVQKINERKILELPTTRYISMILTSIAFITQGGTMAFPCNTPLKN